MACKQLEKVTPTIQFEKIRPIDCSKTSLRKAIEKRLALTNGLKQDISFTLCDETSKNVIKDNVFENSDELTR